MISKIVLHNFMSHAHTELELAPCLTVLTGPNNCGKSAIVAALQAVCGESSGSFMVRHGEKESRVTVETDDGHCVAWRRIGGTVSYVVNGREVHRGVPEDLHDVLQLPTVVSRNGKDEFDVHFGEQKKPLFLINESGGRAATFFASSSDAEYLIRMQKLHLENTRTRKTEARVLRNEIAALDRKIEALSPINDLEARTEALLSQHGTILARHERIDKLSLDLDHLRSLHRERTQVERRLATLIILSGPPSYRPDAPLASRIDVLRDKAIQAAIQRSLCALLQPLASPPEMRKASSLRRTYEALERTVQDRRWTSQVCVTLAAVVEAPRLQPEADLGVALTELRRAAAMSHEAKSRVRHLASLQVPPNLHDTAAPGGSIENIHDADSTWRAVHDRLQVLSPLEEVPERRNVDALATVIKGLREATLIHRALVERKLRLSNLASPEEPTTTSGLSQAIQEVKRLHRRLAQAEENLTLAERAVNGARTDIETWLGQNPTCPVCGAEIVLDRILQEREVTFA